MTWCGQGVGKDIFLDWFRVHVLGTHCTYQTASPEQRIFSRFAIGRINHVLIQIDEVKEREISELVESFKDVITGMSFSYELKNGLEFIQKNLNRVIFTTNNKYALQGLHIACC